MTTGPFAYKIYNAYYGHIYHHGGPVKSSVTISTITTTTKIDVGNQFANLLTLESR